MGYRVEIDHPNHFVQIWFEGVTTLQDIEGYLDEIVVQGAMPYRKLIDSRKAIGKYDDDDVMAFGARISAYAVFERRGPVATVVVTDDQLAITERMNNLGGANRPAKIFFSEAKAREWLATQPLP